MSSTGTLAKVVSRLWKTPPMNKDTKKKLNNNRSLFLIEQFFDGKEDGYAVKNIGNWVLVKQWGGVSWNVAIWEKETFDNVQDMYQKDLFK